VLKRLRGCLGKGSKTVPILKLINTNIVKILNNFLKYEQQGTLSTLLPLRPHCGYAASVLGGTGVLHPHSLSHLE
jgi:hypothetical protein